MTVTVYEKGDCTACVNTKRKLDQEGISYDTGDLIEPAKLTATKALRYMSAPVVVAGDDHWSGFRPDKINELAKKLENGER